jgi:hypothetical protein
MVRKLKVPVVTKRNAAEDYFPANHRFKAIPVRNGPFYPIIEFVGI